MDATVLIDAVVRQTTVLIAQLATAAGGRAPLAPLLNELYGVGGSACVAPQLVAMLCTECGPSGGCGKTEICSPPGHGTASCSAGTCGVQCDAGYAACSGRCLLTSRDQNNCGSCGNKCPGGQSCSSGICVVRGGN